jgi:DNA (cytosine-5)-methyltransferase 1
MKYGSVCSGIEAASVAWHPLGWRASFLSEIEAFPRAVLSHHYPEVPLHGDFTTIRKDQYEPIDLLVGGTPCQSFSIAGLRGGLDDERGNLALEYLKLAQRTRPRWLVWENVPGVLSSAGGRDFGAILGGLVELGYGFAYRVLDAQYVRVDGFGRAVPQRRRRVFVVGHLGDWRRAAAVLFERESLSGNTAPRREAGEGSSYNVAPCIAASGRGFERAGDTRGQDCIIPEVSLCLDGGFVSAVAAPLRVNRPGETGLADEESHLIGKTLLGSDVYPTLDSTAHEKGWCNQSISQGLGVYCRSSGQTNAETYYELSPTLNCNGDLAPIVSVAHSLRADGFDASEDGTGRGTPIVPVAFDMAQITSKANRTRVEAGLPASTLNAAGQMHVAQPVCFNHQSGGSANMLCPQEGLAHSLQRSQTQAVQYGWRVRRLTPTECERLQGFPDGYTDIPWRNKEHSPDGPRYKALGNSMAVNAMRWIGRRIEMVEANHV